MSPRGVSRRDFLKLGAAAATASAYLAACGPQQNTRGLPPKDVEPETLPTVSSRELMTVKEDEDWLFLSTGERMAPVREVVVPIFGGEDLSIAFYSISGTPQNQILQNPRDLYGMSSTTFPLMTVSKGRPVNIGDPLGTEKAIASLHSALAKTFQDAPITGDGVVIAEDNVVFVLPNSGDMESLQNVILAFKDSAPTPYLRAEAILIHRFLRENGINLDDNEAVIEALDPDKIYEFFHDSDERDRVMNHFNIDAWQYNRWTARLQKPTLLEAWKFFNGKSDITISMPPKKFINLASDVTVLTGDVKFDPYLSYTFLEAEDNSVFLPGVPEELHDTMRAGVEGFLLRQARKEGKDKPSDFILIGYKIVATQEGKVIGHPRVRIDEGNVETLENLYMEYSYIH